MNRALLRLLSLVCAALTAACASSVTLDNASGSPVYKYNGEKYGKVNLSWSPELAADADKVARIQQMGLDQAIINRLIASQLYDPHSDNSIDVMLNAFRFRSVFNAMAWGFMAGNDKVDGLVTLKTKDGAALTHFDVSASYALGGWGAGGTDTRMGWLSDKFGELTAATILNKQQQSDATAQDGQKGS